MTTYNSTEMINRFKVIYTNIEPFLKEYHKDTSIQLINDLFLRLKKNTTTIMVCGEFKRGKSTLINAILNEDICPTDESIATSSVSIIKYGNSHKVTRVFETNGTVKEEHIPFDQITQYAKGSNLDIDNTLMLIIEIPNARLKDGLTVIDTPGVGGLNPRHKFLTLSALPKTDAVFYVVAVDEPLTTIELEFFKEEILPNSKHHKIILNRIDLSDDIEDCILDCKKKFTLECGINDIGIIPVSSYLWNEYNNSQNDEDKEFSHCDEVENAIKDICEEYQNSLLPLLKQTLLDTLVSVKAVIDEQIGQLNDPNPEKMKQILEQRNKLQRMLNDIKQDNSETKRQISTILTTARQEVLTNLNRENIILSNEKLNKYLKDDRAISDDGQWILDRINRDAKNIIKNIDAEIERAVESCTEIIGEEIYVSRKQFNTSINISKGLVNSGNSDWLMKFARQSLPAVGIGSLVGFYVAMPIGIVAGLGYLYKSLKGDVEREKIIALRQDLSPKITLLINETQAYINKRFDDIGTAITDCFQKTITELCSQMTDLQSDYQKCQANSTVIANRTKELSERLKIIDNAIKQTTPLLTNPFKN